MAVQDGMDGLAKASKIPEKKIVSYVQNGMSEYSSDVVVKNCKAKLSEDKVTAIYALFNYIMYLDFQKENGAPSLRDGLEKTKKMIKITNYAKKSINYCNG